MCAGKIDISRARQDDNNVYNTLKWKRIHRSLRTV